MQRTNRVDQVITVLAVAALVIGSVVIGVQRARIGRYLYISELGAQGLVTEDAFRVGFMLVCLGITLVAWVLRSVRATRAPFTWMAPGISLGIAALSFWVASIINCTAGCTAFVDGATVRDIVHVAFAVLGFVAGCWAMLQIANAKDAWLRRVSILCCVAVAVIAGIGGLLSLTEGNTDLGSSLEFVAAAIGVVWLIGVPGVVVWHRNSQVSTTSESLQGMSQAAPDTTA